MNGAPEGVLDVRMTEIALFIGGGIVTVMVLALAIWLFVRATREEEAREAEEKRENEAKREREARDKSAGDAP